MAVGRALADGTDASALGLRPSDGGQSGVALYLVAAGADALDFAGLEIRVWAAGAPVPAAVEAVRAVHPRLAEVAVAKPPGPYWLSIGRGGAPPTVVALTVLRDRVATLVLQAGRGIRLHQYDPPAGGDPASAPGALRRAEYLQRLLLAGRLDGARELALELAQSDDPLVGCLCGYALLRLNLLDELGAAVERVLAATTALSDAFVLRGAHAAATGGPAARQAYAEAIAAGIPVFGEGLTRLLEGARVNELSHPRAAVVRYVFQNHLRGSMWSAFTPARFELGTRIVTGADTGYEA
jgi:hypothetical protein